MLPVGVGLLPISDYYLWCDHRAKEEAALITSVAHQEKLEAIQWCGGVYPVEGGLAKLLHWLRHNPNKQGRMASVLENCDMVVAVLCGIKNPLQVPRSICAMGHRWMWNEALGGLPPEEFLVKVDPLYQGIRAKLRGHFATSDQIAGRLCPEWAEKLGLKAGIPVPVGAYDAHWDAIGAGVKEGDVVNVVGTSTCILAIARQVDLIPGVCGVVKGSIHPNYYGIEAGLSATGDIFDAIAKRAGSNVLVLSTGVRGFKAGQTGLLRLTWDNGDRTILVNPELGGVTLGWNLTHAAEDEFFAAMEGTAFHTRVIFERLEKHGVKINRVINGGGIPQKNQTLNQIYANVLNKPVLVPESDVTSLGSAIFAFMAAGSFKSIEDAQEALCPKYRTVLPNLAASAVYDRLFPLYKRLYFAFGTQGSDPITIGEILPALKKIAAEVRS